VHADLAASGRATTAAVASRLAGLADAAAEACTTRTIGSVVPTLVARPTSASEVAAVVRAVAEEGGALVPLGRGAHRGIGHPPARYDMALVTERLDRVIDYTPADMTVTVEAGVTIADLAAVLAREGQWLPLEPPLPTATTVGGLLAIDRSGHMAASEGRVRDFVIGIGVVTAAGAAARAGGRVVKNVAGYDLMKLVIGSLGTLAVVTEVTFKVRPLPEVQHGLVLGVPSLAAAVALGRAIDGALAVMAEGRCDASPPAVVVRLGGSEPDVAAARERVLRSAHRAGAIVETDANAGEDALARRLAALRDFPLVDDADLVVRLASLPDRFGRLARDALAAAPVATGAWCADLARGVLTLATPATPEVATALLAALARVADIHAAHLVVERWPLALASMVTVWHPSPAAFPLMRRMKTALDPAGVLSPGRYIGRL
jgi:glycolate oxidase FAD binding subunit